MDETVHCVRTKGFQTVSLCVVNDVYRMLLKMTTRNSEIIRIVLKKMVFNITLVSYTTAWVISSAVPEKKFLSSICFRYFVSLLSLVI